MTNVDNRPILEITDGTTIIDLLSPSTGITVKDWLQNAPSPKGDGTWVDSPLTEGRKLVSRSYGNITDTFTLAINGVNPDDVIIRLQVLRQLLEKATNYWTSSWATQPVYIKKRGSGETNITYTVIIDWRAPGDANPFAQPFFGSPMSVVDDFQLAIEHGFWLGNIPGTGTPVSIYYQRVNNFDANILYGHALTTADEIMVAAQDNITTALQSNLSYIYRYTDIGAVWSANLLGAARPYTLLGAAADDIVYFGFGNTPAENLIFDILTPNTTTDTVWEWWNGAAWVSMGAAPPNNWTWIDNTSTDQVHAFNKAGVNGIHWTPKSTWAITNVNGSTAYWVRLRVTVAGVNTAQQQNREIYSVKWPYVKIPANQVAGDLPALSKIRISNQYDAASTMIDRAIIAVRSANRGSTFLSFLPATDDAYLDVAYATVTMDETNCVTTAYSLTPYLYRGLYNPGGVAAGWIKWVLTNPSHWFGTFRVFARVSVCTDTITYTLRAGTDNARVEANKYFWQNIVVSAPTTQNYQLVDLGVMKLPGIQSSGLDLNSLYLELYLNNTTGSPALSVYDLVIIPVDEWAVDARYNSVHLNYRGTAPEALEVDSISFPKDSPTCILKVPSTNKIIEIWQRAMNGPPILQVNTEQLLYIFPMTRKGSDVIWQMDPGLTCSVQVEKVQRYFSARGLK